MPPNPSKPQGAKPLDLAQFESLEQAIEKADRIAARYADVGELGMQNRNLTLLTVFFMSALARAQGLHGAIVREIRQSNPHAVFALMRSYAETTAMVGCVKDHPDYARVIQAHPTELPKGKGRKSMQAIINHAKTRFSGFKEVYADLSEIAHFGSAASFASMAPTNEGAGWRWSSKPFWRDEETALIACAQVLELAQATQRLLFEYASLHLHPRSQRPAQLDR